MWWSVAVAQSTLVLDGEVVEDGDPFAFVAFEVPEGTAEIAVTHTSLGDSVLDWGLLGPDGTTRGWGGGNGEDIVLNDQAASRSYLPGLPAGTYQVAIGKARLLESPAPYALSVELRQTATLERLGDRGDWSVPAPIEQSARWYAGDLHVHSLQSGDARASLDQIADLARSRGLDFVVITDHNTTSQTEFLAAAQARHPDLLFIPGMELTTYAGHLGLIGTVAYHDHGLHGPFDLASLIEAVHAEGGLVSVNHPALDLGDLCIGCAFEHPLDGLEVDAVEIQTGGLEPVGGLFTDEAIAFWERQPVAAAIGGSDDHRAGMELGFSESPIGSPTTMVQASELSIEGILEGIRRHRTVVKLQAPDDPMIELGAVSGEGITVQAETADQLRLLRDGEVVHEQALDGPFSGSIDVPAGIYRAELWVGGARRTVTSRILVEEAELEVPQKRCGCRLAPLAWMPLVRR